MEQETKKKVSDINVVELLSKEKYDSPENQNRDKAIIGYITVEPHKKVNHEQRTKETHASTLG